MENCFRCYFRQPFISIALRKCKKDCKILKIILVPYFCPLKTEIARFLIGFLLNSNTFLSSHSSVMRNKSNVNTSFTPGAAVFAKRESSEN